MQKEAKILINKVKDKLNNVKKKFKILIVCTKSKINKIIIHIKSKMQEVQYEKLLLSGRLDCLDNREMLCLGDFIFQKLFIQNFTIKYIDYIINVSTEHICIDRNGTVYIKDKDKLFKIGNIKEYLFKYDFNTDTWVNVTAKDIYNWTGFYIKGIVLSKYEIEKRNNKMFTEILLGN